MDHNILGASYPSLIVQSWFASLIMIKWSVLQQQSLHNEQHQTPSHYALLKKTAGRIIAQAIPLQPQPAIPLLN
jgi:hypothetical protein